MYPTTFIRLICRYVQACQRVILDKALTNEQFCKELLPSILTLSVDKIPNVRLSVSKLISDPLMSIGRSYYNGVIGCHRTSLVAEA